MKKYWSLTIKIPNVFWWMVYLKLKIKYKKIYVIRQNKNKDYYLHNNYSGWAATVPSSLKDTKDTLKRLRKVFINSKLMEN